MNNFIKQYKSMSRALCLLLMLSATVSLSAQKTERPQPKFWFGVSAAANFNFYTGTTQTLNSESKAPAAFHKGFGVKPYFSALFEYTPGPVWGFMFNVAYDARGGKFDEVMAPCNCPANLAVSTSYVSLEPSLRIAPFKSPFYLFIGPAMSYNINNSFTYQQKLKPDTKGEFSETRKIMFSGQIGAGYDIPLSSASNPNQFSLSPFVSYHPYFGQDPRTVESWSLTTFRAGLALKFGKAAVKTLADAPTSPVEGAALFAISAPAIVPAKRRIKETFPLRNYIFFEEGTSDIPKRYVKLKNEEAASFREGQFQEPAPADLSGRSERQLTAYYNILNILGDRMRKNTASSITLIGASAGKGPEAGKAYAESVKAYLVSVFEINESRIKTEGRDVPLHPSIQPGGTKELDILREGDRRVDLVSSSPELLAPVQIISIQEDPLDGRVIFTAASGKKESIKSWSLELKDDKGNIQNYGPFTKEEQSISGNTILGNRNEADYNVTMTGKTKDGLVFTRQKTLHLVRNAAPKEEGLRFSVLFDFDQSKTVAAYEKFLVEVVAPLVPNGGLVIIHGHSDDIGDADHNMSLSANRAQASHEILEKALLKAGRTGVTYHVHGYGADTDAAPFENKLPEERFYNRTVIIDIVPNP
jgi:outer membrane protein OmpA-like peptidoglycan-associated protein